MVNLKEFGENFADKITANMGSWTFIIGQAVFTGIWILLNIVGLINHWDKYPFVLLNLVYSFQAGFTGPILLLSSNRQVARDSSRIEADLSTDLEALKLLKSMVVHFDIPVEE